MNQMDDFCLICQDNWLQMQIEFFITFLQSILGLKAEFCLPHSYAFGLDSFSICSFIFKINKGGMNSMHEFFVKITFIKIF